MTITNGQSSICAWTRAGTEDAEAAARAADEAVWASDPKVRAKFGQKRWWLGYRAAERAGDLALASARPSAPPRIDEETARAADEAVWASDPKVRAQFRRKDVWLAWRAAERSGHLPSHSGAATPAVSARPSAAPQGNQTLVRAAGQARAGSRVVVGPLSLGAMAG